MKKSILTLAVAAAFLLTIPAAGAAEKKKEADTYRLLNLFGDVFERVRTDYVEEVSDSELIEAAINGMLSSLDPHSRYLNAKSFQDMQTQTRGEFGGLGQRLFQVGARLPGLYLLSQVCPLLRPRVAQHVLIEVHHQ